MLITDVCACLFGCVQLFATSWTVACQAPLSMEFPGKNTGVGCHFLLQEIFPTRGLNPCLLDCLHWEADSLTLSHLGSPLITDKLLYLFVWPAGDGYTKQMCFGECLYTVGVDMCTQSLTFQWTVCLSNILSTTDDLFKLLIIMLSLLTIIDSRMNQ